VREYELTIVIQPELSDEGAATVLSKLDVLLEESGSTRLLCEDMGKRKLAYEIQRFHKGHYYLLSFLDEGQIIGELERTLRIEESVLRFMTVKVLDEVVDVEAREGEARLAEAEQQKRAAEKATREAEEAKARDEIERQAVEEARRDAAAKKAAEAGASEDSDSDDDSADSPEASVADGEAADDKGSDGASDAASDAEKGDK